MNPIQLPRTTPSAAPHPSNRRPLLWAAVTALTAATALGVVVPRVLGPAQAQASALPQATSTSAPNPATRNGTVPAASDVFADPESGATIGAPSPTF